MNSLSRRLSRRTTIVLLLAVTLIGQLLAPAVHGGGSTDPTSHILVLGGTRNTGLEVVKLLLTRGYNVTVMVRATSDLAALEMTAASTVVGDAFDVSSLHDVFASDRYSAVISTLSGKPVNGRLVDGVGNVNAMDAASIAGVRRFILVSSLGVGDSQQTVAEQISVEGMKPYFTAKATAEARLVRGDLDYTILRPGGLLDGSATGDGRLLAEPVYGQISRGELARLVVSVLEAHEAVNRLYYAVDRPFGGRSR